MLEKVTLHVFLVCLVCCASLVLFFIWSGDPDSEVPEALFKVAATFFVVGLANFLCWFVSVLYSVREALRALAPH